MKLRIVWAALALAGCAGNPYFDAKNRTAAGGQLDTEQKAANAQLSGAKAENTRLQADKAQRDREIQANDQRIKALTASLARDQRTLDSALKSQKISQQRYDELKQELEAVRAGAARGPAPNASDSEKETRLRELEGRKKALEAALAGLATP